MRAVGIFMAIVSTMAMIFLPTKIYADSACQPVYGGGQTCASGGLSIEKDVINPMTNNDVHDLGQTDPNFSPNSTVTFHITVRNTSTNTINGTKVIDTFPRFLNFATGPGNFDGNIDSLTFYVGPLGPNQAQTFTVTGTVVGNAELPSGQVSCTVNQVTATSSDQQTAQDSSQFCIQPTGVNVNTSPQSVATPQPVTSPATGANPLFLAGFLGLGGIGFTMKLFTRKEKN